jgi:hypothetical protein
MIWDFVTLAIAFIGGAIAAPFLTAGIKKIAHKVGTFLAKL